MFNESQNKEEGPKTRNELITFAYEVGSSIAIPLVIFAGAGRFIDKAQGTSPLFLIIGLLISLISTSIIIWKKVKHFI